LAYGDYGSGKVVWSGLNLPFHAVDTRNASEMRIFGNIMNWFFPEGVESIGSYSVNRPKSEKITVSGQGAKGILIKEHYNPGWYVKLNGEKTKVYKAGLFVMYVPTNSDGSFDLELNYKGNIVHWLLLALTVVGIVVSLSEISGLTKIFRKRAILDNVDEEIY
jgi:hypothetical protein